MPRPDSRRPNVYERTVLGRSDLNVPLERESQTFRIRMAHRRSSGCEAGAKWSSAATPAGPKGRPGLLDGAGRRPDDGSPASEVRPRCGRRRRSQQAVSDAGPGDVLVLENTRFEGRDQERPGSRRSAASLADVFSRAFGSRPCPRLHRGRGQRIGPPPGRARWPAQSPAGSWGPRNALRRSWAGRRSDKLGVIENLLPKVDTMLVGGGMCFTPQPRLRGRLQPGAEEDQVAPSGSLDGPTATDPTALRRGRGRRLPRTPPPHAADEIPPT